MEIVLTALSAMGKSTCREIAARMGNDVRDMLKILENMAEQGQVNFVNGYWSVAGDDSPAPEKKTIVHQIAEPKVKRLPAAVRGEKPAPVEPEQVAELLRQHGSMSTAALSAAVNRNPQGFGTALRYMAEQGHVVKTGTGKGITWSLPDAEKSESETGAPVSDFNIEAVGVGSEGHKSATAGHTGHQDLISGAGQAVEKSVCDIVNEIPSFTASCADDLIIPTSRGISREIRRTKAKLARLEQLRVAVREIRKHKTIIREMAQ